MATERQPKPQGQPQGEGLPIGNPSEPPFVTKGRMEALRDASLRASTVKQGKVSDNAIPFSNVLAPERTPDKTKTRIEEEGEEILRKKKEEEEQEKKIKPPTPPKPPMSLRKKIAMGAAAGVLTVAGVGTAAYYTNDNFHQGVDNNLRKIGLNIGEISVPTSFDNSKVKGVIGENNSIVVNDLSVIQNIEPVPSGDNPKHDINLLFPIQGAPTGRIEYSKSLLGSESNPIFKESVRKEAKENGTNNVITIPNVLAGNKIGVSIEGFFEYQKRPDNSNDVESAMFFYKDSKGVLQQVIISGDPGATFKPLIEANPYMGRDKLVGARENNWVSVKKGQSIMELSQATSIRMESMAWPSGKFGVEEDSSGASKPVYPTNINLIATPDPSTGEQKVVIVA